MAKLKDPLLLKNLGSKFVEFLDDSYRQIDDLQVILSATIDFIKENENILMTPEATEFLVKKGIKCPLFLVIMGLEANPLVSALNSNPSTDQHFLRQRALLFTILSKVFHPASIERSVGRKLTRNDEEKDLGQLISAMAFHMSTQGLGENQKLPLVDFNIDEFPKNHAELIVQYANIKMTSLSNQVASLLSENASLKAQLKEAQDAQKEASTRMTNMENKLNRLEVSGPISKRLFQVNKAIEVPTSVEIQSGGKFVVVSLTNGRPEQVGEKFFEIVAEDKEFSWDVKVTEKGSGTYEIFFQPDKLGTYVLSLYCDGRPVSKASNITIKVIRDYTKITQGRVIPYKGVDAPWGISLDLERDTLYVSETNLHKVFQVKCSSGEIKELICPQDGEHRPYPRAVLRNAANGDIIVTCPGVWKVYVYSYQSGSNQLTYARCFSSKGKEKNQVEQPLGMALGPNREILLADCTTHRVLIFEYDGTLKKVISKDLLKPHEAGGLHFPGHIALYPLPEKGGELMKIFVTNDSHMVQVFDWRPAANEVKPAFCFGGRGIKDGEFCRPTGIAIDPHGNVIVAELGDPDATMGNRIQVFDINGKFLAKFASKGSGLENVLGPRSIAQAPDGSIYVCDFGNKRVIVF